ncbi:MAG: signal peptidase I [Acidobacteriota bacterium]
MAKNRSFLGLFREYSEAILIAAIFLRFANTFVVQTFYIPSGSMEETLLIGDHLFVNRFLYGPTATGVENSLFPQRPIERGDIVVFRSPEDKKTDVVKRCVGIPGDRIEVVRKQLWINGEPVDDSSYTSHRDGRMRPIRDFMKPLVVPDGEYFCMGDNRDFSYDSRYWGTLPAHLVKGRAVVVYWSYGGEPPPQSWPGLRGKLAQLGRTAVGFFSRTRWERTFHLIR